MLITLGKVTSETKNYQVTPVIVPNATKFATGYRCKNDVKKCTTNVADAKISGVTSGACVFVTPCP